MTPSLSLPQSPPPPTNVVKCSYHACVLFVEGEECFSRHLCCVSRRISTGDATPSSQNLEKWLKGQRRSMQSAWCLAAASLGESSEQQPHNRTQRLTHATRATPRSATSVSPLWAFERVKDFFVNKVPPALHPPSHTTLLTDALQYARCLPAAHCIQTKPHTHTWRTRPHVGQRISRDALIPLHMASHLELLTLSHTPPARSYQQFRWW